jgi:hypothetical protein
MITGTTKNDTLTWTKGETAVDGLAGTDTLLFMVTDADLTSATLTSVEILKAGLSSDTTFTVDAADLASGGSVIGSSGSDTLVIHGGLLDLTATKLTSIEKIQAGTTSDTVFKIDQADLAKSGSVEGSSGTDTLTINGASLDLSSTTLTSVEVIAAGKTTATTFIVNQADLLSGGSLIGSTGVTDTLITKDATLDLSSSTVTSVEVLKAGTTLATAFTVDAAELASGGSVIGGKGTDSLSVVGSSFDLTSTTLSSIESLVSGSSGPQNVLFVLDQLDVTKTITGSTNNADDIRAAGTTLDLSSTSLTAIELISTANSKGTTFTVDVADLVSIDSVTGSTGKDTLIIKGTSFDTTGLVLTSVEKLQGGSAASTTFLVDKADLASGGSVIGGAKADTLSVNGTDFDLRSTTLTSVERLAAGATNTTFRLDQADLASGGSLVGSAGTADKVEVSASAFNLSSTTVTGIEQLLTDNASGTIFTVSAAQIAGANAFDKISGSNGLDTLVVKASSIDVTGTTLTSIEAIKAGLATNTTFIIDPAQLVSGSGSVATIGGSTGTDTLSVTGTAFDLTGVTLSSVEILRGDTANNGVADTVFTLDQGSLIGKGSIVGNASQAGDEIVAAGSSLNLTSTTLTSIEKLSSSGTADTVFTVTAGQLSALEIAGANKHDDTINVASTAFSYASDTATSIETLGAGLSLATTFTVAPDALAALGGDLVAIVGSTGIDTLIVSGTDFDLSQTALTSIEKLTATGSAAVLFTLDNDNLAKGTVITGTKSATDEITTKSTELDLSGTTLVGIETLSAGAGVDTTLTVTTGQLAVLKLDGSNGGHDTLVVTGSAIDVSSLTLTSIEALEAGTTAATTFTVTSAQLAGSFDTFTGGKSVDTLVVKGTAFDLTSATLVGVEVLKAGSSGATTFTLDQADLAAGGSVVGSSGSDLLFTHGTELDLSSTTLSSIETLQSDNTDGTTFTVNQADIVVLGSGGKIIGDADDVVVAADTQLDLTSTVLTSIEVLKAGAAGSTTFTVDQADLAAGGSVIGGAGTSDTLVVKATSIDLSATTVSNLEVLKAGTTAATSFLVDKDDLVSGTGSIAVVTGVAGKVDTLIATGTDFDLTGVTLNSIEVLQAQTADDTRFTLVQANLNSAGSIIGLSGNDTISIGGKSLDLSSTTVTAVENVTAGTTENTVITLTVSQLSSLNVSGGSGVDTLVVTGTAFNLSGIAVTDIEVLKSGSSADTTFTVDQADLAAGGSVIGSSSGNDTLIVKGTDFDLSSITTSSIEVLKADSALSTTFTLDTNDLAAGGTVQGSSGTDTIVVEDTAINLSSTTLVSIEKLQAGTNSDTTFTLTQAQVNSSLAIKGNGGNDSLSIAGTAFNLTSATLTSIENLLAGSSGTNSTTFTVDQVDLAAGGSVTGSTNAADTLIIKGTSFDLTSTGLVGIEILTAGSTNGATFRVDTADLAGVSVVGVGGKTDTLVVVGTDIDLSTTKLTSIEVLKAGSASPTTFTLDQSHLAASGSIVGSTGIDTLVVTKSSFDLSSTTLTSIERIEAGGTQATTITVDQGDLASGGTVTGVSGQNDTLAAGGTLLNLSSTTLSDVEILKAGTTSATEFVVNQADLAGGGSVIGSSNVGDTLSAADTQLDLTSTTLTGIEKITAAAEAATVFTIDQADLATGGSLIGSGDLDTLKISGTQLDLSSTTVLAIEVLQATQAATTFIIDQSDLAFGGSIVGNGGTNTLNAAGTSLNLSNVTLSDIDVLGSVSTLGTTFTVDAADLLVAPTITGGTGNDTLVINGTSYDLSAVAISGIETLKAGSNAGVTFKLDPSDITDVTAIVGGSGVDTLLFSSNTDFDLSKISLTSVEHLLATTANAVFKLDQADIASVGTIEGQAGGTDVLVAVGTSLELSGTTLIDIEELHAGNAQDTTFTLNSLSVVGTISGSTGTDTLVFTGTDFNLTSNTLTSIEVLQAGNAAGTTFTALQSELASGGSIIGGAGSDTLKVVGNAIDLSSTTLTSVETIITDTPGASTTFTIGAGQGGATIDLTVNAKSDTIVFASAYQVSTITDDATILAHTLVVDNFKDGSSNGDVLDLSAVTKGAGPSASVDVTDYVALADPATLKDALNIAAIGNGSSTAKVVTFQYGGDTYVLVDNSASTTLTANDAVIKVVGSHTFTDASNFVF